MDIAPTVAALIRMERMSDKRAAAYSNLNRQFLKNSRPDVYRSLQESGELEKHVRSVGRTASEMYETIALQMAQNPKLPEDPTKRQSELKAIPLVAEEIVLNEVVYQPLRHRA